MADISLLGNLIAEVIEEAGRRAPRTQQSAEGIIGASDLGFCQQKAVLMTRGVPQSDSRPILAAQMGTAWHTYAEGVLKAAFPGWTIDQRKVVATFPCGAKVPGTPDICTSPEWNAIVDHKTVGDGVSWYENHDVTQNHRWQRHTYALGAMQEGLLDPDKPVYVGNIFWDRRGRDKPLFKWEEFDPTLTDEIDSWLEDVIYAVAHGEDASRDIAPEVCDKICEWFTVCRGNLPVQESLGPLSGQWAEFVDGYAEARELRDGAESIMAQARNGLWGINGTTEEWQVRWVDKANRTTGEVIPTMTVTRLRKRA